jgi:hypothetical protein
MTDLDREIAAIGAKDVGNNRLAFRHLENDRIYITTRDHLQQLVGKYGGFRDLSVRRNLAYESLATPWWYTPEKPYAVRARGGAIHEEYATLADAKAGALAYGLLRAVDVVTIDLKTGEEVRA